jgi:hypothetical protein
LRRRLLGQPPAAWGGCKTRGQAQPGPKSDALESVSDNRCNEPRQSIQLFLECQSFEMNIFGEFDERGFTEISIRRYHELILLAGEHRKP